MPQHSTLFRKVLLGLGLLLAVLLLTTTTRSALAEPANQSSDTIFEELEDDPRFDTLVEALEFADLDDNLDGTQDYTIFAPVDGAWGKLPEDLEDDLLDDDADNYDTLEYILRFHILDNDDLEDELEDADDDESPVLNSTLLGEDYYLVLGEVEGVGVVAHGAQVIDFDDPIEASNGVIYPIENIMIPPNRPDAWPGDEGETVEIISDFYLDFVFWYIDWNLGDTDEEHSMGVWPSHYWNEDLVVTWDEYDFDDDVNGAYRMSIRQYDLLNGDEPWREIKVAYHWQRNPNPTLFTFGALADGEPLILGHPAYVVVEPATYVAFVDSMTGVTEYEYDLIDDADAQWSESFTWWFFDSELAGRVGSDGIFFQDVP